MTLYDKIRTAIRTGDAEPRAGEVWNGVVVEAEKDWSDYAVTLHQRVERLVALARRRGIDEESITATLNDGPRTPRIPPHDPNAVEYKRFGW